MFGYENIINSSQYKAVQFNTSENYNLSNKHIAIQFKVSASGKPHVKLFHVSLKYFMFLVNM